MNLWQLRDFSISVIIRATERRAEDTNGFWAVLWKGGNGDVFLITFQDQPLSSHAGLAVGLGWDAPATIQELPCLNFWKIMGKTEPWSQAFTLQGWFGLILSGLWGISSSLEGPGGEK